MNATAQRPHKGFGATIGRDAALLIVDMINPFDFKGAQKLHAPAIRAAKCIRALRDRFDRARAPVVYVNDNFMNWHGDFRDLLAACLVDAAPGQPIARLLEPGPGHYYVLKPKHSAFHDTPLEILLNKLKVRRLAMTGISTHSCILASAQDAHLREFALWVPSDCTAAETPGRKRRALEVMADSFDASTRPATRATSR